MDDFVTQVIKTACGSDSELPSEREISVDRQGLSEQTLAEVIDSIGEDCKKQVQSYLEQCQTKQDGE